jgi:uncharacterized coiled-coil protein SlyX
MFKLQYRYQDETPPDGDQGGKGDPNNADGGDKGGSPNATAEERVAHVEQIVSGLTNAIQVMAASHTELQTSLKALTDKMQTPPPDDDGEDDEPPADDLETMSRKDLVNFMAKTIIGAVKKEIAVPLTSRVDALGNQLSESISTATVNEFKKEHPDLLEWKNEIGVALKAGRTNNISDAYSLVRRDDPDKATKLDTKYAPRSTKKSSDDIQIGFSGFPSANGGGSGNRNTRMTQQQAAVAAWDEATSAVPGVEKFLNGG